jgi:hypothetical protein
MQPGGNGRETDPLNTFLSYPSIPIDRDIPLFYRMGEGTLFDQKNELFLFPFFFHLLEHAGLEAIKLGCSDGMALVDSQGIERDKGA